LFAGTVTLVVTDSHGSQTRNTNIVTVT